MAPRRYWIYDPKSRQAVGPFGLKRIKAIKGFDLEALVAPDGSQDSGAWKRAGDYEELRRLFPKPPPLPGQEPDFTRRPREPKASGMLWAALAAAAVAFGGGAYLFASRQEDAAIELARGFYVGDTTLAEIASQRPGAWSASFHDPPYIWKVSYGSSEDRAWLVDLSRKQIQPLTLGALELTVPELYSEYSRRLDAAVAGSQPGPFRELERYRCGKKDCLEVSAGLYAKTAEFDTLPWFDALRAPAEDQTPDAQ